MFSLDFEKSPLEHAVYKRRTKNYVLLVGMYVDDLIITGSHPEDIESFKNEMKHLFSMSDLGLLSYYLGIEVHQTSQGTYLCQSSYASKILDKCGMQDYNMV